MEQLIHEIQALRPRELCVAPHVTPQEIRGHLSNSYPFTEPQPLTAIIRDVAEMLRHWTQHTLHPRHFGLFNPATDVSGVTADALAALYNPQVGSWDLAPAANEIERHTLRQMAARMGLEFGDAHFTSGGSESNHTALAVALAAAFPDYLEHGHSGRPVFYLSAEGHHSFHKVAAVSGLGRRAVRVVATDQYLRMDVRALSDLVARDRADGLQPFMVVGTAGTSSAGAVDPLPQLAHFCKQQGLWLHADAAWGGAAALSERLRPAVEGLQLADSVSCDAHKWLSVPMGCGMFFCRHPQLVTRTFDVQAHYVPVQGDADRFYPFKSTMQFSRRFIGLKLFMLLAQLGMDGLARRLEHQADMGELLRRQLKERGWTVVNSTRLPVVCFAHARMGCARVLTERLMRGQVAWLSPTVVRGETVLRCCVTNYLTMPQDIELLVRGLERLRAAAA